MEKFASTGLLNWLSSFATSWQEETPGLLHTVSDHAEL